MQRGKVLNGLRQEFHFARVTQVESRLKGEGENMGQSRDGT